MKLWRWLGRAVYWLAWPALFIYLRLTTRTRVIMVAENHLVLVRGWMSNGRWGLPGGGLRRGEQPIEGVVRETAEEIGVQLQPSQLQSLASEQCADNGLSYRCHFFAARLEKRPRLHTRRGEITAAEWVPLSEAVALPLKADVRRALELLAAAR